MKKKKIVVIGGGHGQAVILRGIKRIKNIDLTAVVTVADDGGSTGRLREGFEIPAMGDIRNVMIALATSTTLFSDLMGYRFSSTKNEEINGHNLGNLILTALTETTGDFMKAITMLSKVLNVKGSILPSTTEIVTLMAEMKDGTIVSGESNIPLYEDGIKRVFYSHKVKATPQVIQAISEADLIVLGIGSLYTSILPNIIIDDLKEALNHCQAPIMYLCNAMTQPGETDGFTVEDHVAAIEEHLQGKIDIVVVANDDIPESVLQRYYQQHATKVTLANSQHHYQLFEASLLDGFSRGLIRHNYHKIRQFFQMYLGGM